MSTLARQNAPRVDAVGVSRFRRRPAHLPNERRQRGGRRNEGRPAQARRHAKTPHGRYIVTVDGQDGTCKNLHEYRLVATLTG